MKLYINRMIAVVLSLVLAGQGVSLAGESHQGVSACLASRSVFQEKGKNASTVLVFRKGEIFSFGGRQYKIECQMGEGGLSVTYEAECLETQKKYAVKVSRPDAVDYLCEEARFHASVQNVLKGVVPEILLDSDGTPYKIDEKSRTFIVMEMVEGETLQKSMRTGLIKMIQDRIRLGDLKSMLEMKKIFRSILEAVQKLHNAGVLHRDIKPANIMIDIEGNVRIIDLGISRKMSEGIWFPTDNKIVGTPQFMSPEAFAGQMEGPYSDLYSIGMLFFEMFFKDNKNPYIQDNQVQRVSDFLHALHYKGSKEDTYLAGDPSLENIYDGEGNLQRRARDCAEALGLLEKVYIPIKVSIEPGEIKDCEVYEYLGAVAGNDRYRVRIDGREEIIEIPEGYTLGEAPAVMVMNLDVFKDLPPDELPSNVPARRAGILWTAAAVLAVCSFLIYFYPQISSAMNSLVSEVKTISANDRRGDLRLGFVRSANAAEEESSIRSSL